LIMFSISGVVDCLLWNIAYLDLLTPLHTEGRHKFLYYMG
jgi:hypothetical protein